MMANTATKHFHADKIMDSGPPKTTINATSVRWITRANIEMSSRDFDSISLAARAIETLNIETI